MEKVISYKPIGYFYCKQNLRYSLPRQPLSTNPLSGYIELLPHMNYEQALSDLEGFSRIWLIAHMHENQNWKPKVYPPRGDKKRGVFATRSPHRPNSIGLSCVKLCGIEGRKVFIEEHDFLNGTPILDIKPYLNYADCYPDASQGWVDTLPNEKSYDIEWTLEAEQQLLWINQNRPISLQTLAEIRLSIAPYPFRNRRIKKLSDNVYELAIQTWRLYYMVNEQELQVSIKAITSGYVAEKLFADTVDEELIFHRQFMQLFPFKLV